MILYVTRSHLGVTLITRYKLNAYPALSNISLEELAKIFIMMAKFDPAKI